MYLTVKDGQKILIVGTSCTGKTTLAVKIGEQLNIPHFDLDDFHWLPNWVEQPDIEMLADIKTNILPIPKWIVSGNYTNLVKATLWKEADTIIWLDYSLSLILSRFFKRTYKRIVLKEACCNGNYENFYNSFLAKDNLFFWILKT